MFPKISMFLVIALLLAVLIHYFSFRFITYHLLSVTYLMTIGVWTFGLVPINLLSIQVHMPAISLFAFQWKLYPGTVPKLSIIYTWNMSLIAGFFTEVIISPFFFLLLHTNRFIIVRLPMDAELMTTQSLSFQVNSPVVLVSFLHLLDVEIK